LPFVISKPGRYPHKVKGNLRLENQKNILTHRAIVAKMVSSGSQYAYAMTDVEFEKIWQPGEFNQADFGIIRRIHFSLSGFAGTAIETNC